MIASLRMRFGRLFLLGAGILLTSTAGHTAARVLGVQIATESPGFAFQLAVLLAILLVAVHVAAICFKRPFTRAAVQADQPMGAVPMLMQAQEAPAPRPDSAIAQLKLPAGLRLDGNDAVMITTGGHPERRILYVNNAFARLTGFGIQELLGGSGDLLLADGPLRMESLLWLDAGADGRENHWIARLHRRDGTEFCAEAHLHPLTAADGGISHVVLVMTDVTSRVASKARNRAAADAQAEAACRKLA